MKSLYKGQHIAVHVLDEHILPRPPLPLSFGGTIDQWKDYYKQALEIAGPRYNELDIAMAGYFVAKVEEVVGDQVITQEEAPKAFEIWLAIKKEKYNGG